MKSALGTLWKQSIAGVVLVPLLAAAPGTSAEAQDRPVTRDERERETDEEARRDRRGDEERDEEVRETRRRDRDDEEEADEEREARKRDRDDRERPEREARRRDRDDEDVDEGRERRVRRSDDEAAPRDREDREAADARNNRPARIIEGFDPTRPLWDATTGRQIGPAGNSLDVVALATTLVDAVGVMRIAKFRSERLERLGAQKLVGEEERTVAALELETAQLKVDLLRQIATEALRGAEAALEVAAVEEDAARQRHEVGAGPMSEVVAARGRVARAESSLRILRAILGAAN